MRNINYPALPAQEKIQDLKSFKGTLHKSRGGCILRPTLESRCACVRSQGDMSGKNIKTRVMRTFECTTMIALRSESRLFIVYSRD